jgi:hypothetical protein
MLPDYATSTTAALALSLFIYQAGNFYVGLALLVVRKRMVASRQAFVPLSIKCRAGNIYTISATYSIEVRDNNDTPNLVIWMCGPRVT